MEAENEAKRDGLQEGVSPANGTPETKTNQTPIALDEAKVSELIDARARAIAESIAEQKAKDAEERAYRRAQSKYDADQERIRKEQRERLAKRDDGYTSILKQSGVDDATLERFKREQSQEDEAEELRQKARMYDGVIANQQADQQKRTFIENAIKEESEEWGIKIDPADSRLDTSSPEAFQRSLRKVVKATVSAASKPAPPEKPAKDAKNDLDVLSGGGGKPEEKTDPKTLLKQPVNMAEAYRKKYLNKR